MRSTDLNQSPLCGNLLESAAERDVVGDPFPHIVVRNPLPDGLADRLVSEFPPDAVIRKGRTNGSNLRFDYDARDILGNRDISPIWRSFIEEQSSPRFFGHVVRLFGPWIRKVYPGLIQRFGHDLERVRAGVRYVDNYDDHDLLIDARMSINTPVTTIPTSVREVHLDLPTKLFVGLFYLRADEDRDSKGGNLVTCRYREGVRPRLSRFEVEPRTVEEVDVIPYAKNVLFLFLNTPHSLHAVTPRFPTPHTRRFVNLVGEVSEPLFDMAGYQEPRAHYLARRYLRQLFAWTSGK